MRFLVLLLAFCLPLAAQEISGGGGGGASNGEELSTLCNDGEILFGNSGELDCGELEDISSTPDISTGLVHHWAMEPDTCSGDATSVTDDGSAGEDLTCTNTPQWSSTTPAVGSCVIDFTSSSSEYCETATSPTLPTGNFTWAFWARPDSADSAAFVVMDGSGGNEWQFFFVASSNNPNVAFKNTNHTIGADITGAPDTGDWLHVGMVRIDSAFFIYFNGRLAATRLIPEDAMSFSTCQVLVGVDADATCDGSLGNYFNGQIDDFRVYSRVLTQEQVAALYDLGN